MIDFLDKLAKSAAQTIHDGYYRVPSSRVSSARSLKNAIIRCRNASIISEIKFSSPSKGMIRKHRDLKHIAESMQDGGAVGISVLTEPRYFDGCLESISEIQSWIDVPILMKDIIISPIQINAASKVGASSILLIQTLFNRGFCKENLDSMISHAQSLGLEVLLETHSKSEFQSAITTSAEFIGINNRDLKTLKVDLGTTQHILLDNCPKDKTIISESGISGPNDVKFLKACGAHAFLVGTAIMKSDNIKKKTEELVTVL